MLCNTELLFSDLLSEAAFKPETKVEIALEITKPEALNYKFPLACEAPEDEVKRWWLILRNYFNTGAKPKDTEQKELIPVLLSSYLASDDLPTDYPLFLPEENAVESQVPVVPFSDFLYRSFKDIFKDGEAVILFKNLSRIESSVKKYVGKNENFCRLNIALDFAIDELSKLKISGEEGIIFLQDLDKFKNSISKAGELLGFSQQTPIRLLSHILRNKFYIKRKIFISEINRLKAGLKDLLTVEKYKNSKTKKDKTLEKTFGFADSMIEFDKLDELMPESASEKISKQRYDRIKNSIKTLESAESLLLGNNAIVIIGNGLSENNNYKWENILKGTDLRIAELNKSCSTASEAFNSHITALSKLMASVRIAELEVKNKFDEKIHGDYFSRFNWHYFTEDELALCPPVILIEETQNLLGEELPHFSALLSSDKPVKALAINKPLPFKINMNGGVETQNFVSLGALAISHRNAFVHQSASHNPIHLLSGFESGLASSSPALFHVLTSANANNSAGHNFLDISASVEGRQFPLFTYNDTKGEKWGSRFDISSNPQPDKNWPVYSFEAAIDNNKTEKIELAFTFADFFALNRENSRALLIVPAAYWTEDLIPLNEYIELLSNPDTSYGYSKVPFIWLADSEKNLYKAAVPYSLVVAAKERLNFWNFIQELGGVNSFHVEQAINRTRLEMLQQKEQEVKDLEIKLAKQVEEVRASAAGEAMNNLAGILLDLESITASPDVAKDTKALSTEITESKPPEDLSSMVEEVKKEVPVSAEPWVENFRCTSCNECVDKYPRAFKYDSEKLAYVDDPSTVTFAQIVKAAEACPAKCIHPGMPLNPDEPGLDDLIAKAKPFN